MNDNFLNSNNKDTLGDKTNDISAQIDAEYNKLKVANELSKNSKSPNYERDSIHILKNKVQAKKVMEVILPILTNIKNEVINNNDLNDLKEQIDVYYSHLFMDLEMIGITLQEHKPNQYIDPNEKVKGRREMTTDPDLHQKVARCNKMGCIIKGEEDNPILEDVTIYVCNGNNGENSYNTNNYPPQPNNENLSPLSSQNPYCEKVISTPHQNEYEAPVQAFNNLYVQLLQNKTIQFLFPIDLITTTNQVTSRVLKENQIQINKCKKIVITKDYLAQKTGKISLGGMVWSKEFSLKNLKLCFRVVEESNYFFLEIFNKNTKELILKQQLILINK